MSIFKKKKKTKLPVKKPIFHLTGIRIAIIGTSENGDNIERTRLIRKDIWFKDGDRFHMSYDITVGAGLP